MSSGLESVGGLPLVFELGVGAGALLDLVSQMLGSLSGSLPRSEVESTARLPRRSSGIVEDHGSNDGT